MTNWRPSASLATPPTLATPPATAEDGAEDAAEDAVEDAAEDGAEDGAENGAALQLSELSGVDGSANVCGLRTPLTLALTAPSSPGVEPPRSRDRFGTRP